jgi:hypothetical protein
MRINFLATAILVGAIILFSQPASARGADSGGSPAGPSFQEVYELVRSTISGLSDAELNRAAVDGFLKELESKAGLVAPRGSELDQAEEPLIGRASVFEGTYAYLRIGRVGEGLAEKLTGEFRRLSSTNRLAGVVLDLRYAGGYNYAAAAEAADLFTSVEQLLLTWNEAAVRSTQKFTFDLPFVVLINSETRGAAEALAAVLRETAGGLIIGGRSAGRAYVFKQVGLSDGRELRIASGVVRAGEGVKLTGPGVVPDIQIVVSSDAEQAYLDDPYRELARAPGTTANEVATRAPRKMNEAELIRIQREGADYESRAVALETGPPSIKDPALARGLDLLKGLALAQRRR